MRTAILITARLKSTRLPMKAIKTIKGRALLSHLVDRLKLATGPEQIIICTSPITQDDPLEKLASVEGVDCFRGHPEDVLARLTAAAGKFNIDLVISCTADNPFVDPIYIDKLVDFHIREKNDFSRVEGLPFGTFSYALSFPAMVKVCEIKDEVDTEVWGGYFTQTGLFKCGVLQVKDERMNRPKIRLTVDEPEDFELVEQIFDRLYEPGKVFGLDKIISLIDESPELREINMHIEQKPGIPIKLKL